MIDSEKKHHLGTGLIWDKFKEWCPGSEIPYKPRSYESEQYGTISQRAIVDLLENDFSAERPKSKGAKRELVFSGETFARLKDKYHPDLTVKVSEQPLPAYPAYPAYVQDKGGAVSESSEHEEADNKTGPLPPKHMPETPETPEATQEDIPRSDAQDKGGAVSESSDNEGTDNKGPPTQPKEGSQATDTTQENSSTTVEEKEPDLESLQEELQERDK